MSFCWWCIAFIEELFILGGQVKGFLIQLIVKNVLNKTILSSAIALKFERKMTRLEFNISFKKHRTDIQTFGKISFVQVHSLVVKVLAPMTAVKKKKNHKNKPVTTTTKTPEDTLCSLLTIFKTNQNRQVFTIYHALQILRNRQMQWSDLSKHH